MRTRHFYLCRRGRAEREAVWARSSGSVVVFGETVKAKAAQSLTVPMDALDKLDFDILRELMVGSGAYLRNDRVSLGTVARAVGVHRSTVADRIAKWTRIGFLGDWTIDVDPAALGLVGAHVHFQARAQPRERALHLAALVEGVEGVLVFDQGWVAVIFMADSPAALMRTETLIARILEAERSSRMVDTALDYPETRPFPLSPLDAKLLTVLLQDSRQTPAAIAKKTHVTVRTVERRLERLRTGGVYYVRPIFHFGRIPGVSFGLLCFQYSGGARGTVLRRVLRLVTSQIGRQVEAPTRGMLLIHGSARELSESAELAASVPGVNEVVLRTFLGETEAPGFPAWLSERIDRQSRASKVAITK
jgi:DNA-binding Lrp family transcriptional regulator